MSERMRGAQRGRRQRDRQPALPTEEKATDVGSKQSRDLGSGSICVKQHLPCGWPSTGGRVDREEGTERLSSVPESKEMLRQEQGHVSSHGGQSEGLPRATRGIRAPNDERNGL